MDYPAPEEMRVAIEVVIARCNKYRGRRHANLIAELGARLKARVLDAQAGADSTRDLKETYLDAVASLLSLATPPGQDELNRTMAQLNELVDSESQLKDVEFVESEPRGNDNGVRSLRQQTRPSRHLTEKQRVVVKYFIDQMPQRDWPRPFQRGTRG